MSSFDHELLKELDYLNSEHKSRIEGVYLYNFDECDELPEPHVYTSRGKGINISSTKLTQEIVHNCHSIGQTVGVWIDRSYFTET